MVRFMIPLCLFVIILGPDFIRCYLTPDERIVDGEGASIYNYPYMGSLRFRDEYKCACIIITEKYVITAAKCADGYTSGYRVRVGSDKADDGGEVFKLKGIHKHPDEELALMQLKTKIKFFTNKKAVQLPGKDETVTEGMKGQVLGWGTRKKGGIIVESLKEMPVVVMSEDSCSKESASAEMSNVFCAGSKNKGQGTCEFDGGDALMIDDKLHGVAFPVDECAKPGFYADVNKYLDWINDTTRG